MTIESLLSLFLTHPSICTDTRKIKQGDIFLALKGPRFNGNLFAAQALEAGAAYAIIDEASALKDGGDRYILVENGLQTLQDLARAYRRSLTGLRVFALTGSNGKTTTKELLVSVLSQQFKVWATQGNLNNHIGVPLTLLAIPQDTELAVIEMGANQPGDIQELVEIAEPDMGLITNVGHAHLEKLGDLEGVRYTKGALFRFIMAHGGQLFVNQADERVAMTAGTYTPQVTYGTPQSHFHLLSQEVHPYGMALRVSLADGASTVELKSQLTGTYNAFNALAAVAVGHTLGLSLEQLQAGIHAYVPENNRSQQLQKGVHTIWLDAYNANPSSMEAAVRYIFSTGEEAVGLIIGDMYELGDQSEHLHRALGRLVNEFSPTWVIGVGGDIAFTLQEIQYPTYPVASAKEAGDLLSTLLPDVKLLLIKGSRGVALEKVLDYWPSSSGA